MICHAVRSKKLAGRAIQRFNRLCVIFFCLSLIVPEIIISPGIALPQMSHNNNQTSMEQSIEVARMEARRLGYDLDNMDLEYDEANSAWNGYCSYLKRSPMHENTKIWLRDLSSKLSKRKYRAIYFLPQNNLMQGDSLFVFVDAKTGDVLGVVTSSQLSP